MTVELEFLCDVCGFPVGDGGGCLQVRFEEIHEYRQAAEEWKRVNGAGPHRMGALLSWPDPVPWRIFHDRCNPAPDAGGYDVDVRNVRTWQALVAETARLMQKNWLALTDWPHVIGSAAEGRSSRIKELVRGGVA